MVPTSFFCSQIFVVITTQVHGSNHTFQNTSSNPQKSTSSIQTSMLSNAQEIAIAQFLQSGNYDVMYSSFDGRDHFDRIKRGHRSHAEALVSELRIRESKVATLNASIVIPDELQAFTRAKVEPMVRGLVRKDECELVLSLLEVSVEFVTAERIEELIFQEELSDAWEIANLYLRSIGAEPISSEAPNIVDFSTKAKCLRL